MMCNEITVIKINVIRRLDQQVVVTIESPLAPEDTHLVIRTVDALLKHNVIQVLPPSVN